MSRTLRLPPDPSAPAHARRWLGGLCVAWSCEELADDASLLVTELTTNAVLHAATDITVTAAFDRFTLTVSVADSSPAEATPRRPAADDETGRGLFLVRSLAHRCGTRLGSAGKSVWFTLRLPGNQPADPAA